MKHLKLYESYQKDISRIKDDAQTKINEVVKKFYNDCNDIMSELKDEVDCECESFTEWFDNYGNDLMLEFGRFYRWAGSPNGSIESYELEVTPQLNKMLKSVWRKAKELNMGMEFCFSNIETLEDLDDVLTVVDPVTFERKLKTKVEFYLTLFEHD